jgi:dihydroxyacid dehydratase/phosphogluconate dehydratase
MRWWLAPFFSLSRSHTPSLYTLFLIRYDANISLPGCDKNMPGTIMAAARLDRPSLMIYGGTIKPGKDRVGEPLDIVSAFQSYGKRKEREGEIIHGRSFVKQARVFLIARGCR